LEGSKNLFCMFTVPISNERIIKIVNKHKVITNDIPLTCHICSIFVLRIIYGVVRSKDYIK
ncbi:MAG: hypothetical protein WBW34_04320, partial [Nitrososphaeraceae archaeon]